MWRLILTLTRREQAGMLSLFFILVLLLLLFLIEPSYKVEPVDSEWQNWVNEVIEASDSIQSEDKNQQFSYHDFNPNTASKEELIGLGFSEFAANNIMKYRQAGGKISSYEKLIQIYGMDTAHLQRIKTHLKFPARDETFLVNRNPGNYAYKIDLNIKDSNDLVSYDIDPLIIEDILKTKKSYYFNQRILLDELQKWSFNGWLDRKDTLLVAKRSKNVLTDEFQIELNAADTAELVLLKGIGNAYAHRIIYYRNRLGGFYELDQLSEVDGISPVVLFDNQDYVIIDTNLVAKIDINTASLKRMKDHPYMDFYMARDIYELRKDKDVRLDEMLKLPSFSKANKTRIRQYFTDKK